MALLFSRRKFLLTVGSAATLLMTGISMNHANSASNAPVTFVKVSFPCEDSYVVANLYLPENYDPSRRYPAVAVGGSLSSVKEMMGGFYAGELALRGIIALALDYRNYGESGGARRQYEDQVSKSGDLSAALRFLRKRSDVSGTGLLGICTSGGTIMYTAAKDQNVGAIAAVAGFFTDPDFTTSMFTQEGVEQRRAAGRAARKRYDDTGVIEIVPAYEPGNKQAVSASASEYYMDKNRGGGVRPWCNEFALMGWEDWLSFDPITQAAQVKAPALIIHSDGAAFPDQARRVYGLLAGSKELHWTEGKHFDFYDDTETVQKSADRIAAHFHRTLN
jgi:fermentation-respiration switch protein FrsA (DUF1100 family)